MGLLAVDLLAVGFARRGFARVGLLFIRCFGAVGVIEPWVWLWGCRWIEEREMRNEEREKKLK